MRLTLVFVVLIAAAAAAAAADHVWHQRHCTAAFRSTMLVTVGADDYGFAEYSYRHMFSNASVVADPRDVVIYAGPAVRFLLSKTFVWMSALLAIAVCMPLSWPSIRSEFAAVATDAGRHE